MLLVLCKTTISSLPTPLPDLKWPTEKCSNILLYIEMSYCSNIELSKCINIAQCARAAESGSPLHGAAQRAGEKECEE